MDHRPRRAGASAGSSGARRFHPGGRRSGGGRTRDGSSLPRGRVRGPAVTPSMPALSETTDLSETAAALCLVCILLIPCALGGLAMMAAGLGRSRNVAHSLLSALCAVGVAAV